MILRSTKSYWKLPCAHMQWFDRDANGNDGPCAKWHGYDRSVHFEFTGEADQHGWIVGFGNLKPVKQFLEYYFDHTALISADDPRMEDALAAEEAGIVDLRILPYGVSMEMSSIFIWEEVNPYIYSITDGRAYISRVECREHDGNSAFIEISKPTAFKQAKPKATVRNYLLTKREWEWVPPQEVLRQYK